MSAADAAPPPGPHDEVPLAHAGETLERARAAVVLVHGRGAGVEGIVGLAAEINAPGTAYLMPGAAEDGPHPRSWYPNSFLASLETNEPGLSSALRAVHRAVEAALDAGIPLERIALAGFSQGACLAAEYAARHAARYGAVIALSGGLIGPPGTPRNYPGSLEGTPVFLGCSDVDPHIPAWRVEESARVLEALGGDVTARLYRNFAHAVNDDELEWAREHVAALTR